MSNPSKGGGTLLRSLRVVDPSPFIIRAYRQSKKWQWLREGVVNSIEAKATRIEIGVEAEAIAKGIYRYAIYDNGCGIAEHEFDKFIFTYGGGGKPIGEACENFGIGLKACLLPWNKHGLVVVSVKDGYAAMVWLEGQQVMEEGRAVTKFGAHIFDVEDDENPGMATRADIIEPMVIDDIDYEKVIPDWIGVKDEEDGLWYGPDKKPAHGTVLILLGDAADEDTILGDRSRNEAVGVDGGRAFFPDHIYLEQRFWEIPKGVQLTIRMPNNAEKSKWPNRKEWVAGSRDVGEDDKKKVVQRRTCNGAKVWIEHPYGVDVSEVPKPKYGTVDLDGPIPAKVHWFLRSDKFPKAHWHKGHSLGYIAALYDNELYDRMESKVTGILNKYNRFGIYHGDVQRNLFLIFEPQVLDTKTNMGVYPIDSRSHLICNSTEGAGVELPWDEWAIDFKSKMPDAIKAAENKLDEEIPSGDLSMSEECKRRVAKYGDRYYVERPFVGPKGPLHNLGIADYVDRTKAILDPREGEEKGPRKEHGTRARKARRVKYVAGVIDGGTKRGMMIRTRTNFPIPDWKKKGDFESPWNFARYERDQNKVWLNEEHRIYTDMLEFACSKYQCPREDAVKAVRLAFGTCLCTKVAHVYGLKPILASDNATTDEVVDAMLSPESLTTAALGFHDIENDIERLLGRFGVKKAS